MDKEDDSPPDSVGHRGLRPSADVEFDTRRAHITFLLLGGMASMVFIAFVYAFGYYGELVNAGLDKACAESAFQSGKRFETLGNFEEAVRQYRLSLAGRFGHDSQEYACRLSLGDALARLNRNEEAVDAYDQLPEKVFDRSGMLTGYVTALVKSGGLEKAELLGKRWLELARAEDDRQQLKWASTTLGQICEDKGRLDEAATYYIKASALDPVCEANVRLARVLRIKGQYQQALAQLDRFLAVAPSGLLKEDSTRMRDEIATLLRTTVNSASPPWSQNILQCDKAGESRTSLDKTSE